MLSMSTKEDTYDAVAGTVTIHTTHNVLVFPVTALAAEAMSSAYLRGLCQTNDPNGDWGMLTTLISNCAVCGGDGCDDCDYDGCIVRSVKEGDDYDNSLLYERGVEREDLLIGALQFGKECLEEFQAEQAFGISSNRKKHTMSRSKQMTFEEWSLQDVSPDRFRSWLQAMATRSVDDLESAMKDAYESGVKSVADVQGVSASSLDKGDFFRKVNGKQVYMWFSTEHFFNISRQYHFGVNAKGNLIKFVGHMRVIKCTEKDWLAAKSIKG